MQIKPFKLIVRRVKHFNLFASLEGQKLHSDGRVDERDAPFTVTTFVPTSVSPLTEPVLNRSRSVQSSEELCHVPSRSADSRSSASGGQVGDLEFTASDISERSLSGGTDIQTRSVSTNSLHSSHQSARQREPIPMSSEALAGPSSSDFRALDAGGASADRDRDAGPMIASPPPQHVEPEVPDPFLVDSDEPDESSSDEEAAESRPQGLRQTSVAEEISLEHPTSPALEETRSHPKSPVVDVNKAMPAPPDQSDDDDEEDVPDLYLPQLVLPQMFLPIPNSSDPLTNLLVKYVPQPERRPVRDLAGDWQRSDFHTLVMTNSWRALARMARDRLVTTDPEDLNLCLGLWYLRLSSLARLRLFNQTSAECTNLFAVLNAIDDPAARTYLFDRVLPFELEVMQTRLKYWAGDHMGYLDALSALLHKCKRKARAADAKKQADRAMWQERGSRVCLILASQLMEMKDFVAAADLLEPLCKQGQYPVSPEMRSAVARVYLQAGNVAKAAMHYAAVDKDPTASQVLRDMNAAMLASARGDWASAAELCKAVTVKEPENFAAVNNLAVALLSQGNLQESIEVLESALRLSPASVAVAEPYLFNLSTMYELRSATAVDKKRDLLIEVAKWSGDGLKTTCLKMPSN